MKNQIKARLTELETEYQKGQERLSLLEKETAEIHSSMLRISGAIQVLQEIIKEENSKPNKVKTEKQNGKVKETV